MNIELPRQHLDLSSAIAEGDIRVLLMVLVHVTGDEKWLEPPYTPKRDVRLIPDPDAGVPKEIQDEIRAAVLNLFANGAPTPVITDPGDELMLRMMRATLGEHVARRCDEVAHMTSLQCDAVVEVGGAAVRFVNDRARIARIRCCRRLLHA